MSYRILGEKAFFEQDTAGTQTPWLSLGVAAAAAAQGFNSFAFLTRYRRDKNPNAGEDGQPETLISQQFRHLRTAGTDALWFAPEAAIVDVKD